MDKEKNISKIFLITVSILFLFIMVIMPLIIVLTEALKNGVQFYFQSIKDTYTLKALKLTLLVTVIATIVNTLFGIIAAWVLTKFKFKGKNFLSTLIDIPFAISPIIAGLIFVMTFGRGGLFEWLTEALNVKIVFAVPGIILATLFVTFPFISRELIPLMNSQGKDEEEAAALMGASLFTIFRRITFPKIKWGLLYGIVLCIARSMGEFGAVSVVSGHIRGVTNTLPLHIEILYNEYKFTAAFAVSSILVIAAIIILILRNLIQWKGQKEV